MQVASNRASITLFIAFLAALAASTPASSAPSSANTEDAIFLYRFKAAIKEDPFGALRSWKLDSPVRPCDWDGVDCDVTVLKSGVPVVRGVSLPNRNMLGTLWEDLGKLRFLKVLNLTGNRLQGHLPSYISQAIVLETLDLSNNGFTGPLPDFKKLTYLKNLILFNNRFEGDFPGKACNGDALRNVDMSNNNLRGTISRDIFRCSKLETLKLPDNALCGDTPAELGELTGLRVLNLARNQLTGGLPEAIGKMTYLTHLLLNDNQFTGFITPWISSATYMIVLDLSNNQIGKNIPNSLGSLAFLERLSLSNNKLQGSIPEGIGKLTSLVSFLDLSNNMLTGSIPAQIGNLEHIQRIDLSHNRISGVIPDTWGGCLALRVLDISDNRINGSIPASFEGLPFLQYLNLSRNYLSGELPSLITSLKTLSTLDISHNSFKGSIPDWFGTISGLVYFDGSYNQFTGSLPRSLENLTHITVFDMSHNNLSGFLLDIPLFRQFAAAGYIKDEEGLCGPVLNVTCKSPANVVVEIGKKVYKYILSKQQLLKYIPLLICATLGAAALVLALSCLLLRIFRPKLSEEAVECCDIKCSSVLSCCGRKSRLSYKQLCVATDHFSNKSIIGVGNCSKVYWGKLPQQEPLAIKVIDRRLLWETRPHFLKDCKLLRNINHDHVMHVIDWSYKPRFLAIVYKYMPRGSLYDNLYAMPAATSLSWEERLGIAIDVAHGLAFLHNMRKRKQIVCCQLCPSNILLDKDCRAYVGGLHVVRELQTKTTDGILTRRWEEQPSPGDFTNYLAPECRSKGQLSKQAEVYSYGLTVLELITRKRSAIGVLSLGKSLPAKVRQMFPHRVKQFVDTSILRTTTDSNQVLSLLKIALSCTEDDLNQRPDMDSVVALLEKIKTGDVDDVSSSSGVRPGTYAETSSQFEISQQNPFQMPQGLFLEQGPPNVGMPFYPSYTYS